MGLAWKLFLFEFLNNFNVYFYIAFFKASREGCLEPQEDGTLVALSPGEMGERQCLHELQGQLQRIPLILFLKNAVELGQPFALKWAAAQLKKLRAPASPDKGADESSASVTVKGESGRDMAYMSFFVEQALRLPAYGGLEVDGTFAEFAEVMIIYGYTVLFAIAFPLAPLLGAVLIIVELRVDSYKLFHLVQRPFPRKAGNIGTWSPILSLLSWLGLFTNAGLLTWTFGVFRADFFAALNLPDTVWFIFLSGVIIAFKLATAVLVPDVPAAVQTVRAHHENVVRGLHGFKSATLDEAAAHAQVSLGIDAPASGQLRYPEEYGMLEAVAKKRIRNNSNS